MLFTAIIVSCLWLLQMAFFEGHFQNQMIENMRFYGERLKNQEVDSNDFNETEFKCSELGINVYVLSPDVLSTDKFIYPKVGIDSLTEGEKNIIETAVNECYKSGEERTAWGIDASTGNRLGMFFFSTQRSDGAILVLTSSHANLVATINVIRWQFAITTVIVIIIGISLAWILSVRLSKPIDEMSATAKKWADGDQNVTFNSNGNYAEINELADTLNYAKESVSKAGVLQRDLLANVSHDLKTPLTMIRAYAEMIKDISGDNKAKREKHTQVIMDETDRLTMLVNDILHLSKLQSSVDGLTLTEVNLSELTEKVISRFSSYVENQGFTIENYVAPDLLTVVDEQKIEQVIYNLLGNSLNYTGEDKVVKVYLTAENDKIILEIIDSGKGISQEKLETIWERYYRFSETNTRPVKGTGLGLSIVKTILDNHKLRFGVRSKKDCGSNFYVEFNRIKNE